MSQLSRGAGPTCCRESLPATPHEAGSDGLPDAEQLRIVDWGDASLWHPFVSLAVTYRFLEERNGFRPTNPRFAKLRDAYLEPWGTGLVGAFELASVSGASRTRSAGLLVPAPGERAACGVSFRAVLRRALAVV